MRLECNGDVDTGDTINLRRSWRFMKILAFTVMSWLSRRYKLRKVHAKIPRGREWEGRNTTDFDVHLRRDLLLFFARKVSFNFPCTTCCAILTDERKKRRKRRATFSKCSGTSRIKIMTLISRSSLVINASHGEVFVGSFHYSHGSLANVMAWHY